MQNFLKCKQNGINKRKGEDMRKKKEILSMIAEIIGGQKKCLFFLFVFTVISSLLLSMSAYVDKEIVDSIQRFEKNKLLHWISFSVLVEVIVIAISNQLEVQKMEFSYRTSIQFTKKVIHKIKKIRFELLEDKKNLDLIERVYEQSEQFPDMIHQGIRLFSRITVVISYVSVLGTVSWYFSLITIGMTIPYFFMLKRQGFERYEQEVEISTDTRKIDYLFQVLSSREYQKEIKTFQLTTYLSEKYFNIRKKLWKKRKKLLVRHSLMAIVVTFIKNSSFLICMVLTCILIIRKETGLGSFMLVLSVIEGLRNSTLEILELFGDYNEKGFYLSDFYEFMKLPEEQEKRREKIGEKTIRVENVSFRYPNARELALNKISTIIGENEMVAIVGENGSGKSTFVNLLLGLYEPQEGEIRVGNHLLREVLDDMREKTGVVLQNFNQYQFTIEENLLGNKKGSREDWEKMKPLLSFVEELPKTWQTPLGQLEEKGIELSGGNWQRIALGRAFLKKDSEFLLLDEPVSAFDPKIENEIYEQLPILCKNKTTILISHRLSVTKVCNRILVFDKGQIVEEGTHEQLMEKQGIYFKMYQAQQSLYET